MKDDKLTKSTIMKCADWAYEKAIDGIPYLDSAIELAESYKSESNDMYQNANALIRWQNAKSALSGFATGFGGFYSMPLTLPINITSVLYIQIRMIAAIAYMGGYDLRNDRVKALVYACLVENSAADVAKHACIKVGEKAAIKAIDSISRETIKAINRKVGQKLITKFGEKGVVNLGKCVPLLGSAFGGAFDAFNTNLIGNVARDTFITHSCKNQIENMKKDVRRE